MCVLVMEITLRAEWSHSLKEKRAALQRLIARLRNRFNISVIESDTQEAHQLLTIGIAALAADTAQGDSIAATLLDFIYAHTEAEVINVFSEYR